MLDRPTNILLAVLLISLLALQASSLFVAPVPDSIRWFGDESWLMTESIATVETGKLHHPRALSSTLAQPKGLILLNTPWLRTLVYGVPAYLAFPTLNPVDVGRVISFIIGLLTILAVALVVFTRTRNSTYALISALLLTSSSAYFYASHSARFDILTGLVVLCFAVWITSERYSLQLRSKHLLWLSFAALMIAIGLPVHLYLHLAVLGVIALLLQQRWRSASSWSQITIGVVGAFVLAVLLQLLMSGELRILDSSMHRAEFSDVTRDIPLLKLSSFSSQLSVLQKNTTIVWQEAMWLFLAIPLLVLSAIRRKSSNSQLAIAALAVLAVWYFLQRPHPAYLIHVLPVCACASVMAFHELLGRHRYAALLLSSFAVVLTLLGFVFAYNAGNSGQELTEQNTQALARLSDKIERGDARPVVLVEASVTKHFLQDTSIRLMTTHFQFFPTSSESIAQIMARNGVDHAILFNTANYGYDRNAIDPLVKTIQERGVLLEAINGRFFDIGREYGVSEQDKTTTDTIFLYKVRN